jgi:hypothetical protein
LAVLAVEATESKIQGRNQEGAVKLPRIRIAWVMFAVAILAVDFTVMRALLDGPPPLAEELLFGALPMANVLVVGLLIAFQRPPNRAFLLGFELFGAIALTFYIALAILSPGPSGPIRPYVAIVLDPIVAPMGLTRSLSSVLTIWLVVLFMLGWPQVTFALIGGFLSRRYKVTINRR